MLTFWIAAALLIVAALAFVLVPLLRSRAGSGPTVREANLAILRGQRQDIETDVTLGLLPRDARETALAELTARADEDLAATGDTLATATRKPWGVAAFFAVLIPVVTVGFYLWVGTPAVVDPKVLAAAGAKPGDHQIEEMVLVLEKKMQERPDDVEGWMLLARSYAATGKMEKALSAYAHLAKIAPGDASILADYADALALSRGRNLAGEPMQLVMRALQADPRHPKALALAGTAKLNSGEFAESLVYWERLYAVFPAGSSESTEARDIIEDVRARAAAAGKPLPPSKVLAAAGPAKSPAAAEPAKSPAMASPKAAGSAGDCARPGGQVGIGNRDAGRCAAREDGRHGHALHLRARGNRLAHPARHPAWRCRRVAEGIRARRFPEHVAGRDTLQGAIGGHRGAHLEGRWRGCAIRRPRRHQQAGRAGRQGSRHRHRQGRSLRRPRR